MLQDYFSGPASSSFVFDDLGFSATSSAAHIPQASCFQDYADEFELWFKKSSLPASPDYAPFEYLAPNSNATEVDFEYPALYFEGNYDTTFDEVTANSAPVNLKDDLQDKDAEGELDIQDKESILCTYSASELLNMEYTFVQETVTSDRGIIRPPTIFRNTFAPTPSLSSPSPSPSNSTSSSLPSFKDWKTETINFMVAPTSRKRKIEEVKLEEPTEENDLCQISTDEDGKRLYQCCICPQYSTRFKRDIRRHFESRKHKEPSYFCDSAVYNFGCDRAFTRVDALKRHIRELHRVVLTEPRVTRPKKSSERSEPSKKRQRKN